MVRNQSTQVGDNQSIAVPEALQAWLLEIAARNYTDSTRKYYTWYLGSFADWLNDRKIAHLADLSANHIRQYQSKRERTG